ncbi:MAG: SH3 domain-containing protein [Oscillospiraceae bacterium]|nr:SH3 domain-containing protein [Oscillospiraceae bacterium]
MSFLKCRAKILGAVISVMFSVTLLGNSLIHANITDNYRSWKQTDSNWSNMTLGTSGGTVASIGCAVTSAAMLMVKSGAVIDSDFNPAVLIAYLNQNNGFSAEGDLNWNALAWYAPDFKFDSRINLFGTDEEKINRIQDLLNDGYYVIAQVKNGAHFVAVDYIIDSEIFMMDPGSTSSSLNERYGIDSMTSLRVFRTAKYIPQIPEESNPETNLLETAPDFVLEAPATAPIILETISEPITETTTTVMATESTTSLTTTTTTSISTTTETTTTTTSTTTTSTTTTTTMPEIVITTKATTETTAEITECEIVIPAEEFMPEIVDPLIKEYEENIDSIQVVVLESAPEIAPDVNNAIATEATRAVYISDNQARTLLVNAKEKNFYLNIKFYIQTDLCLRATPDTSAEILNIIPEDTYLDVVEVDEDFKWGKVVYENQEGWISLNFASLSNVD